MTRTLLRLILLGLLALIVAAIWRAEQRSAHLPEPPPPRAMKPVPEAQAIPDASVLPDENLPPAGEITFHPTSTILGRMFVRRKLEELDQFRRNPRFHTIGFARIGPYYAWLEGLNAGRDREGFGAYDVSAIGDLYHLAWHYMHNEGLDNDESTRLRESIRAVVRGDHAAKGAR